MIWLLGTQRFFQFPQDFCPILELVILTSSQGQDCTNQEEEGRAVKDRPNGFVQRACDEVVGWGEFVLMFASQVSSSRQGEKLQPAHVCNAGLRRLHQPKGAVRGAQARHPEPVECQGSLGSASY